jgi:hypothetical protein
MKEKIVILAKREWVYISASMKSHNLAITVLCAGLGGLAHADEAMRIGHTTLIPRHSNPDDKGMYAAAIDPTNGYAYFLGNWLSKLDISGNLPAQVGPSISLGQSTSLEIDVSGGFLYETFGGLLKRYALGAGTNVLTATNSLSLAAGSAQAVLIDDSDANPSNHSAYVLCAVSGSPGRVAKVALGSFTEIGSIGLNSGETNGVIGQKADPQHGYAYFVTSGVANTTNGPRVVKIKMTTGANLPVRIGAAVLDTNAFIDGGSIDTLHGYAYYGTYDSDTNVPGRVYKVRLEAGDVSPTLVGHIDLHAGEGRLSASVCDPANGFVYFANDNTYPGAVVQFSLNGTNLPVEINYLQLQSGPQTPPPNGITANNTTTNMDGVLPFGEVFIRSAVFDPVRGNIYLGQDSRPNQIVKVQAAQINPFSLTAVKRLGDGSSQFGFTNIMGAPFDVLTATNLTQPLSIWTTLGAVTDSPPGHYQFIDPSATNGALHFYRVRSP